MGKMQRRKGATFERQIVRWLKDLGFSETERNLTETRTGNTGDVFVPLKSLGLSQERLFRIVIQAKSRKSPSPWKAMDEAREAAGKSPSDLPVAIVRRTHDQTLVCMEPALFGALLYLSADNPLLSDEMYELLDSSVADRP